MSEKPSGIPSYDDMLHELGDENRKLRKQIESLEADYEKCNAELIQVSKKAIDNLARVKALEAELQRLRDENAGWMTKAQTEFILRMKADKRAESAESRLAEAEKLADEWTLMVTEYEETFLTIYKIDRLRKALRGEAEG